MAAFLQGATCALSIVAALFFFRFWRDTRDAFFALFALAFALDAVVRFVLVDMAEGEQEPLIYLGRLLTFLLIIVAILRKNRRPHAP